MPDFALYSPQKSQGKGEVATAHEGTYAGKLSRFAKERQQSTPNAKNQIVNNL